MNINYYDNRNHPFSTATGVLSSLAVEAWDGRELQRKDELRRAFSHFAGWKTWLVLDLKKGGNLRGNKKTPMRWKDMSKHVYKHVLMWLCLGLFVGILRLRPSGYVSRIPGKRNWQVIPRCVPLCSSYWC